MVYKHERNNEQHLKKTTTWAMYIPSKIIRIQVLFQPYRKQISEDGSWFFKVESCTKNQVKLNRTSQTGQEIIASWWSWLSMTPQKFNDPRKRGTSTFGSVFPSSEVWPTMSARFQRRLHAMPCANSMKTWNSTRHMMCSTKLLPP